MCGIAGLYTPNASVDRELLQRMMHSIHHRGPDDGGVWVQGPIGLANRRLSILDLSAAGHQPMSFPERQLHITFNGEVYNFRTLKVELEKQGYVFHSGTDTEVVLKAYAAWGDAAFARLRGMFALAIWDAAQQELVLARDPFGIKPLYYAQCGAALAFGSELKVLRLHPQFPTTLNRAALAYYLAHLYIPEPASIYAGAARLPAGCALHINVQGQRLVRYYQPQAATSPPTARSEQAWLAELRQVLLGSVQAHLEADVPVGVFLSGGVDSSALVALMRQAGQQHIKTFTIGFSPGFGGYDERPYARIVAQHFQTEHHELVVQPELETYLRQRLLPTFDEPFANPAALISDAISELASREVKVVLAGVGGDELFAGYPRYQAMRWLNMYTHTPLWVRQWVGQLAHALPHSPSRRNVFERLRRFTEVGNLPPATRYATLTSFAPSALISKLLAPALPPARNGVLLGSLTELLQFDMATYLPGDLLTYADRTSMAHSLEVRVPFCDVEVAAFAQRLPDALRIRGLELKYGLKAALAPLVPRAVLYRPKGGFSVPLGEWLSGPLRPLIHDYLAPKRLQAQSVLQAAPLTALVQTFDQGDYTFTYLLWAILIFNLWQQNNPVDL